MDKTLGKEYPEGKARVQYLEANCDQILEMNYSKQFTQEQITLMKDQLSDHDIKINDIEEEKKAITKTFKEKLEPMKRERQKLLTNIRHKSEYVKEQVYKFIYQDERTVAFFNSEGALVESRPCNPDELQKTIFQVSRNTGSEN
jgi:small-conductance mechanosensitive channel